MSTILGSTQGAAILNDSLGNQRELVNRQDHGEIEAGGGDIVTQNCRTNRNKDSAANKQNQ